MYEQLDIFSLTMPRYRIEKPVRLIELFAGIGSQAMAMRDLDVGFEHYRVIEFDRFAVASYNAIHGTDFQPSDIRQVTGADLGIANTDNYCYIMTYSFPCQDLSVAGKKKGMAKGGGTRSGLLWEVERLLDETDHLPQVLLMENVPQVHGKKNLPDFEKWIGYLSGKGYSNCWQDLNAKDYGVAQNRKRCFMVSILGKYYYKFPHPVPLEKTMKDYLEDEVDEKYYIETEKARKLIQDLVERGLDNGSDYVMEGDNFNRRGKVHGEHSVCRTIVGSTGAGNEPKVCVDLTMNNPKRREVANCITAHMHNGGSTISNRRQEGNGVVECKVRQIGNLTDHAERDNPSRRRVYDSSGLSPALQSCMGEGGNLQPFTVVAMRGRNRDNPSDRTPGAPTEQRIEPNSRGLCNTITSVQKDNMVLETPYRIRKLTPLECWRLMGFSDEDFLTAQLGNREAAKETLERYPHLGKRAFSEAQRIKKMSNTQLYKQAGNSIVKHVLMAVFGQMIGGEGD